MAVKTPHSTNSQMGSLLPDPALGIVIRLGDGGAEGRGRESGNEGNDMLRCRPTMPTLRLWLRLYQYTDQTSAVCRL